MKAPLQELEQSSPRHRQSASQDAVPTARLVDNRPDTGRLRQLKDLAQAHAGTSPLLPHSSTVVQQQFAAPMAAADSGHTVQAKSVVRNYGQAFTWGPNSTIVGKKMEAWLDPNDPVQGESANINVDQSAMMDQIRHSYGIHGGDVVKGHLLNDNLGGKALNNNLFPISRAANKQHLVTTENYAKAALWTHKTPIWYTVEVGGTPDLAHGAHQFNVALGNWDMVHDVNGPAKVSGSITSDLGKPKDNDIANSDDLDSYSAGTLKTAMSNGVARHPHTTVGGMSAHEQSYRDNAGSITNTEHKATAYTKYS
jgi:hypothetical protein